MDCSISNLSLPFPRDPRYLKFYSIVLKFEVPPEPAPEHDGKGAWRISGRLCNLPRTVQQEVGVAGEAARPFNVALYVEQPRSTEGFQRPADTAHGYTRLPGYLAQARIGSALLHTQKKIEKHRDVGAADLPGPHLPKDTVRNQDITFLRDAAVIDRRLSLIASPLPAVPRPPFCDREIVALLQFRQCGAMTGIARKAPLSGCDGVCPRHQAKQHQRQLLGRCVPDQLLRKPKGRLILLSLHDSSPT